MGKDWLFDCINVSHMNSHHWRQTNKISTRKVRISHFMYIKSRYIKTRTSHKKDHKNTKIKGRNSFFPYHIHLFLQYVWYEFFFILFTSKSFFIIFIYNQIIREHVHKVTFLPFFISNFYLLIS